MYNIIQKQIHNLHAMTNRINHKVHKADMRTSRAMESSRLHIIALILILIVSWVGSQFISSHAEAVDAEQLQRGIASEIIRFHVIANSDSEEDQALKYKVKDALVKYLAPYLKEASDISEGREIIKSKLSAIHETAEEVIKENGYGYSVKVTLEPVYFPMKVYGDYTFPPGTYEALRVQIGNAEGKNWWCVMFPPLCFVDETYSIVDTESEKQLKYVLTEEEYERLRSKKVPVKVRFKLFESIGKLFN